MCGIAGLVRANAVTPNDIDAVRRMTESLYHRGPDSEGFLTATNASLGMRRLSIIDQKGGSQPIYNAACPWRSRTGRTIAVIANGEIYNYRELRDELVTLGHQFTTQSDTESIVHAFEEWDSDCVHRLRGMFAFAVVESLNDACSGSWHLGGRDGGTGHSSIRRLFLARDRLGVKPLYFYHKKGVILFSSEVKALLRSELVPRHISRAGLYSYLAYGSVQDPLTMVSDVYSLSPGHRITIDLRNIECHMENYWNFSTSVDTRYELLHASQREIVARLRAKLEEAVRIRLVSDVPLGAFLSGGIDSGAIVHLMRHVGSEKPTTFNIGFRENEFNEADLARKTSARAGSDHHEILVTGEQVLGDLQHAVNACDQPTVDGINTYYVSRAAKQEGLTVALSGLGGDEIFAGYDTFKTVPRMMRFDNLLKTLPSSLKKLSTDLWYGASADNDRNRKLAAFLNGDRYFDHPYFASRNIFTPQEVSSILESNFQEKGESGPWNTRVDSELEFARYLDPVNTVSYLECRNYLSNTLLRDTDAMSMIHSLEVRVPFLDHELIEFMMALAGHKKMSKTTPKHLLVKAMGGELDPEVVHRKKGTFTFPWDVWLRSHLHEEVDETLQKLPYPLEDLVGHDAVLGIWRGFQEGHRSWSRPWSLYVLFKWIEKEID